MKYYIECPFYEKDEAKSLGARWDPEERKWYYTDPSKKYLGLDEKDLKRPALPTVLKCC